MFLWKVQNEIQIEYWCMGIMKFKLNSKWNVICLFYTNNRRVIWFRFWKRLLFWKVLRMSVTMGIHIGAQGVRWTIDEISICLIFVSINVFHNYLFLRRGSRFLFFENPIWITFFAFGTNNLNRIITWTTHPNFLTWSYWQQPVNLILHKWWSKCQLHFSTPCQQLYFESRRT